MKKIALKAFVALIALVASIPVARAQMSLPADMTIKDICGIMQMMLPLEAQPGVTITRFDWDEENNRVIGDYHVTNTIYDLSQANKSSIDERLATIVTMFDNMGLSKDSNFGLLITYTADDGRSFTVNTDMADMMRVRRQLYSGQIKDRTFAQMMHDEFDNVALPMRIDDYTTMDKVHVQNEKTLVIEYGVNHQLAEVFKLNPEIVDQLKPTLAATFRQVCAPYSAKIKEERPFVLLIYNDASTGEPVAKIVLTAVDLLGGTDF